MGTFPERVGKADSQRADRCAASGGRHSPSDILRATGFTVGAGNADQHHFPARMAVEPAGDLADSGPKIGDRQQRNSCRKRHVPQRIDRPVLVRLPSHRRGTVLQRLGEIGQTMAAASRTGQEQTPLAHLAAVEGDGCHLERAGSANVGEPVQQQPQTHPG